MNNIDRQYKELLDHILHFGVDKEDRTRTGTKSIFGWQIRHNMKEGFPLLTTKKMAWKTLVTELLWFLRGDTNIKYLVNNNCHIWNGDAIKNYEKHNGEIDWGPFITKEEAFIEKIKSDDKFAREWGNLGPIYGAQWRMWSTEWAPIDQIQNLINELKTNPDSRRLMVNAWNVGELDQMVLPPCHYGFQCWTREQDGKRYLSLMWNQRSVDTFLGLPFNIASYALLLEIIAREVDMIPDELIGNLGDCHLYNNHIKQAKEQLTRTPYELPRVKITERNWYLHQNVKEYLGEKSLDEKLKSYRPDCFELIGYESHPKIKAPLSN